jgi:serine/threonine-protein kinase
MHAQGYVHADMKPNNIVVQGDGNVKIIDLGQACKIGTVKERIQGTPDYIAPEQVHRREITPKTDVYNLGATMYWVLTRKNIPTALTKEDSDSLLEGIDEHMIESPTPAHELNPRVPNDLSDLIDRCVKPFPDDRPTSMDEVIELLSEVIEDEEDAAKQQEQDLISGHAKANGAAGSNADE